MRKDFLFQFFLIFLIIGIIPNLSSAQWIIQNTPFNSGYYAIFFISENTGWAAGDGFKVIKTTNGGDNWIHISTPDSSDRAESMYFLNKDTGFVGTYKGKIFRTNNGGINWTSFSLGGGSEARVLRLKFINSERGWAVGQNLIFYMTTNKGVSWFKPTTQLDGFTKNDIDFINDLTGYTSGSNDKIWKTTNGGYYWIQQRAVNSHAYYYSWFSLDFINEHTGWVGSKTGVISKTTNGGTNWSPLLSDTGNFTAYYSDFHFINDTLGYASTIYFPSPSGGVLRTINGGNSWTSVAGGESYCEELVFPTERTAYGSGGRGKIYKTSNATLTDIINISSVLPKGYLLHQNYPNPFNPTTKIKFEIPTSVDIKLIIYNSLGKEIENYSKRNIEAGIYEYEFSGEKLASGVYYYQFITDGVIETKKMILLK